MTHSSLRILHIGNFLKNTLGTYSVSEALAERFSAQGHQVITTSRFQNRLLRLLDMLSTTLARQRDYDIAEVAVYSGSAFRWAEAVCALLQRLKKPYVLTLHGGNLGNFAARHPNRVRRLLASAQAVVTPSHMLRTALLPLRADIEVLPNGIDLHAMKPYHERTKANARLAWLRAIQKMYAPQIAVEVIANLKDEFPEIQLDLIGPNKDAEAYAQISASIDQLRVRDRVQIHGAVPHENIANLLQHADIFLNTTTIESFGVSVVEAAALGLCIVSTNVGELPYIWQHEQDALLIPPQDAVAATTAVKRLLTDPVLAATLSRNARRKAESFDWEVIIPRWERLFRQILNA
ncbi:MAG: glycosyltransferase family 4 protein [Anaerolineae bacterium]